jgi:uncharacterized protein (DUF1501 family)
MSPIHSPSRRSLLKAAGWSGIGWLTPLADTLALQGEKPGARPPKSVILLWMQGGASQLDTWDPHPDSSIAHGAKAIQTSLPNVLVSENLPRSAELLEETTLLRSVVSREGDHERATYQIKTGYRMDPSVLHPSIGAVICHELPGAALDIPTHVSILPGQWPARGGFLGAQWDAFKINDPAQPIPDTRAPVGDDRFTRRLTDLSVVEGSFAAGRAVDLDSGRTLHRDLTERARHMMSSDQLAAFDVNAVPVAERALWGDTPFGRGCLAAARLVRAGVRCVEVTLPGWDTHIDNLQGQAKQAAILDQAWSQLIRHLKAEQLLDRTIVICGTEFGRTPDLNGADGRDHWPHGFSVAIAGGGFRRGHVHGATDPSGEKRVPADPISVADIHATVQSALGLDPGYEFMTSAGRPVALSEGKAIATLLES